MLRWLRHFVATAVAFSDSGGSKTRWHDEEKKQLRFSYNIVLIRNCIFPHIGGVISPPRPIVRLGLFNKVFSCFVLTERRGRSYITTHTRNSRQFFLSTECRASSSKLKSASSVLQSSTQKLFLSIIVTQKSMSSRKNFGFDVWIQTVMQYQCRARRGKLKRDPLSPVHPSCRGPHRSFFSR